LKEFAPSYSLIHNGDDAPQKQNSCNTVFPRDIVCLRNISVNTLHKGDDYDNDNNDNNNNNNNI